MKKAGEGNRSRPAVTADIVVGSTDCRPKL